MKWVIYVVTLLSLHGILYNNIHNHGWTYGFGVAGIAVVTMWFYEAIRGD